MEDLRGELRSLFPSTISGSGHPTVNKPNMRHDPPTDIQPRRYKGIALHSLLLIINTSGVFASRTDQEDESRLLFPIHVRALSKL